MGGNVFKDTTGGAGTQRIRRDQVIPTVKWLEGITGLNLQDNMLGTTGRKDTSGDLDLAVDSSNVTKDVLIGQLLKRGFKPEDIKKSGDSVHLKTPIEGDIANGYVQTDFMFGDPAWQRWSMSSGSDESTFKGVHRHLLLASIAKSKGLKWSYKHGLVDRATNEVVTNDPQAIAEMLIHGNANDLNSVESIINKIKTSPDYMEMTADFRDSLAREPNGPQLNEHRDSVGSTSWFRTWNNL